MRTHGDRRGGIRHAALLLLLAAACPNTTAPPPPAPPTAFTVRQDPGSFDVLIVTWTPPAGSISGYEADGRLEDGPWESLGAIPADAIGGTLTLEASLPELTHLAFRIRSVRDGKTSGWVEASFLRGLRWPLSAASSHAREGVRVTWTNPSTAATGLRISRLFGDAWRVMAELPPSAASYVDAEALVAGQAIRYRLAAFAGAVESLPAEVWDEGYPPSAVLDLTATPEAGGARLRWVNPPVAAASIEIDRAEGLVATYFGSLDPVVLPSTATEYLDVLPGGTWTWHVTSRYPQVPARPYAQVRGISNPAGDVALAGSLPLLPDAAALASDGGAVLAFAVGGSFYPPATGPLRAVFRGAGAPPDVDLGTGHGWAAPSVAFDAGKHPHAVVLRPGGAGALVRLVHASHDGAAWSEVEVATRALDDPTTVRFALDAGGAVHAAWSTRTGAARVEYAYPAGGGFATDDLTAALPADAKVAAFEVDGLGSASIAIASGSGALLARRGAGWDLETIPVGGVLALGRSSAGLLVLGMRVASVPVGGLYPADLVVVERTAAGWGAPEVARALPQALPMEGMGITRSASGGRTVLWGGVVAGPLELDVRQGGAWTHVDARPAVRSASVAWFDAGEKLHLLARSDAYADLAGNATYVQYVEP